MWMSVGSFSQPINGRCPGVPSGRLGVVCCGVPFLLGLSLFVAMICFLLEGLLPTFFPPMLLPKLLPLLMSRLLPLLMSLSLSL